MSLSRYHEIGKDEIKITLKWDKVAKRIDELIQLDRYLNKKEKEYNADRGRRSLRNIDPGDSEQSISGSENLLCDR